MNGATGSFAMPPKTMTQPSADFVHEIGGVSIRSAKGIVLAAFVFALTLGGGCTFLSFVVGSHVYHEWIETAFFAQPPKKPAGSPNATSNSWRMALKATDVRKIGHIVDRFEMSFLESLDERVQEILSMNLSDERQHALASFASRMNANRTDILHIMHELEALRDGNLEGAPVEFVDINGSLDRLKAGTDVLAVAAAELESGADQVTLHTVQKQLDDAIAALSMKERASATSVR
jgi:hypothetical protein